MAVQREIGTTFLRPSSEKNFELTNDGKVVRKIHWESIGRNKGPTWLEITWYDGTKKSVGKRINELGPNDPVLKELYNAMDEH